MGDWPEEACVWIYIFLAIANFAVSEMEFIKATKPKASRFRQWRDELQPSFHWTYSSVLIPFFLGMGVAVVAIAMALPPDRFPELYIGADILFGLFFFWTTLFWLTSDPVRKRDPEIDAARSKLAYRAFASVGCLTIAVITAYCIFTTHKIWRFEELSQLNGVLITPSVSESSPNSSSSCRPPAAVSVSPAPTATANATT
jgi:hypothetical protein